ncbi:MAG TPA: NAD-dependent epimerase/dehydratase family protein [Candidatus Binatia bacterium]|nr:NAD-dependent epimerase/dehydratase family protein [Candidatus Binatia bacterium]
MKPTLVTGANGHVGNNLCRELVGRGERVRAMIRPGADPAPLGGLDVEIVRGDIMDPGSSASAVDGCGRVYHVAAGFLMWSRDPERDIIRPSVEGTRHVLEAAAKAGVEKVVYTSSSGTIGHGGSAARPLDERDTNTEPHTHYLRGKIAAEKEAFAIAKRTGLAMTSIHPGLILGPRFWKTSESVAQVVQFVNQGAPAYFDGGFSVVDVEDVAHGAVLAMEKGANQERYILAGENVTVKQMFDIMAELTGLKAPAMKLPVPLLRVLAGAMEVVSRLTGGRPMLDRSQVDEFGGKFAYFDSSKAVRELGYTYRSARETVRRTVAWVVERGFVAEKRRQALQLHPSLTQAGNLS